MKNEKNVHCEKRVFKDLIPRWSLSSVYLSGPLSIEWTSTEVFVMHWSSSVGVLCPEGRGGCVRTSPPWLDVPQSHSSFIGFDKRDSQDNGVESLLEDLHSWSRRSQNTKKGGSRRP